MAKGLKAQFEIDWSEEMLKHMLTIMAGRGQVEMVKVGRQTAHRIKEEKVIQL